VGKPMTNQQPATVGPGPGPSAWRAWCFLVRLSALRQARAHLMVWVALGLLALTLFIVGLSTRMGVYNRAFDRDERGRFYVHDLNDLTLASSLLCDPSASSVRDMALGAYRASVYEGSSFYVFTRWVVFEVIATFLIPLWSIGFATEGVGREREAQNLLWVLMRPLPRWAIYLAKFAGLLPWCLLLNLGGFALICLAGGRTGLTALSLYWPAVLWGTLAFASLFHLLAAAFRHAAVLALLYSFFIEMVVGNLPRDMKRFSLSFYMRSMMYDEAGGLGIRPENPLVYQTVSGTTACLVLAGTTVALLAIGAFIFSRKEYLDVG
jgi:ABC-type transport system involved in multi-copper enzyme maturation permease subunit